jgi:hypothetical protein
VYGEGGSDIAQNYLNHHKKVYPSETIEARRKKTYVKYIYNIDANAM